MNLASLARSFHFLSGLVAVAAAAHAQACSDGFGSYNVIDDPDGRRNAKADGAAADRADDAPLTTLRIANLAPDMGEIDVCYQAARSGTYEGPLLRTRGAGPDAASTDASGLDVASPIDREAAADDGEGGVSAGLGYATVSRYVTLEATGTLLLAVVAPGATTCSGAIAVGTVTLDPGKLSTVALLGDGDGGQNVVAFTDDRQTAPDKARVRMIHGADAGILGIRVVGARSTVIAELLEPRHASSPSSEIPVDALGFATIAPVAPPAAFEITALAGESDSDGGATTQWQSEAVDLDLRGESLHTGFVLGTAPGALEVLWCADKSTAGDRTTCTHVR